MTRGPTHGSLCELPHEKTCQRAKGVADRRGGRGKCVENRKKILNSGNEPKNVWKTTELSFSGAKNELVFECKNAKTNSKKRPKNPPFVRNRSQIRGSKGVSGWVSTRGATQAAEKLAWRVIPRSRRRRGISHCLENTKSEIPRSARNDSLERFFRSVYRSFAVGHSTGVAKCKEALDALH